MNSYQSLRALLYARGHSNAMQNDGIGRRVRNNNVLYENVSRLSSSLLLHDCNNNYYRTTADNKILCVREIYDCFNL